MKERRRVCEFASERSELLLRNFRESIARQSVISIKRAFEEATSAPAPRFWVSEARAMRIVSMMLKGVDIIDGMYEEKKRMYREIFDRVNRLKTKHPEMPLGDIVFEVVNSPAPCSYLSWDRAGRLIVACRRKK